MRFLFAQVETTTCFSSLAEDQNRFKQLTHILTEAENTTPSAIILRMNTFVNRFIFDRS
jgi:hypothetical protein